LLDKIKQTIPNQLDFGLPSWILTYRDWIKGALALFVLVSSYVC